MVEVTVVEIGWRVVEVEVVEKRLLTVFLIANVLSDSSSLSGDAVFIFTFAQLVELQYAVGSNVSILHSIKGNIIQVPDGVSFEK